LTRPDGIDWDISVWHLYGEDLEWAFVILKEYYRPIWITETNHPYGSQNGAEAQAEGLVSMMRRFTIPFQALFGLPLYDDRLAFGTYRSFSEVYLERAHWARNYDLPIMIAELGYRGDEQFAPWADQALADDPRVPRPVAVVYFQCQGSCSLAEGA
jgi:hypothetical protein